MYKSAIVPTITLDSNILIWAFFPPKYSGALSKNEDRKEESAKQLLKDIGREKYIALIPTPVLGEFISYIGKGYDASFTDEPINIIKQSCKIIDLDEELLSKITRSILQIKYHSIDSTIAAIANYYRTTLVTFDKELLDKLRSVKGLTFSCKPAWEL